MKVKVKQNSVALKTGKPQLHEIRCCELPNGAGGFTLTGKALELLLDKCRKTGKTPNECMAGILSSYLQTDLEELRQKAESEDIRIEMHRRAEAKKDVTRKLLEGKIVIAECETETVFEAIAGDKENNFWLAYQGQIAKVSLKRTVEWFAEMQHASGLMGEEPVQFEGGFDEWMRIVAANVKESADEPVLA
jgi:hypothetical protein